MTPNQCHGSTKKKTQCKRQSLPNSNYCSLHDPINQAHISKKNKNNLNCTKCESTNVRSLPEIFKSGIRSGASGTFITSRGSVGISETSGYITPYAATAAPPEQQSGCLGTAIGMVMVLLLLGSCVGAAHGNSSGGGVFLLVLLVSFVVMIVYFNSDSYKEELSEHKSNVERWSNTYRCKRCGHEFYWTRKK